MLVCSCTEWCVDGVGHWILESVAEDDQSQLLHDVQIHDADVLVALCFCLGTGKVRSVSPSDLTLCH